MRTDLPQSHIEESMKLEAQGYVELFKLDLYPPNGSTISLFLCPTVDTNWQGKLWNSGIPCSLSGDSYNVSGEETKPKFSIANPNGTFSRYVHQRYTENATVSRYRVLTSHINADLNIFQLNSWRWSKTISLGTDMVVAELRGALSGHNFKIPAETYRPPKYPAVSVQ